MIPNSLLLPLGIDKLKKSLVAERKRKFPNLMLSDHELYGDNYGQCNHHICNSLHAFDKF